LGYAIYQGKTLGESASLQLLFCRGDLMVLTRTGKEFLPHLRRNPKVGVLSKYEFLELLMNPSYTAEKLITFLPSKSLAEKPSS
jgi:hypothetical protein